MITRIPSILKNGFKISLKSSQEGTIRSAKSWFDRQVVCERSLAGQHKCSVPFFWNGTDLGDEFVTPIWKMEKIIGSILKIWLKDIVVLHISYKTVYIFLALSSILKGLCTRLKNKGVTHKCEISKTPTECYKLSKEAYGENFLSCGFKWYKQFSEGRESTKDDQRPGRPVSVSTLQTVTKINEIVWGDCMSNRMTINTVNADKETVRKILHDKLNVKKVCVNLVPKNLTPNQKLVR